MLFYTVQERPLPPRVVRMGYLFMHSFPFHLVRSSGLYVGENFILEIPK